MNRKSLSNVCLNFFEEGHKMSDAQYTFSKIYPGANNLF